MGCWRSMVFLKQPAAQGMVSVLLPETVIETRTAPEMVLFQASVFPGMLVLLTVLMLVLKSASKSDPKSVLKLVPEYLPDRLPEMEFLVFRGLSP